MTLSRRPGSSAWNGLDAWKGFGVWNGFGADALRTRTTWSSPTPSIASTDVGHRAFWSSTQPSGREGRGLVADPEVEPDHAERPLVGVLLGLLVRLGRVDR